MSRADELSAHPSARGPAHVALCVALALLAWSPAILRGGFVLDDREVLERNPVVQGSLPWTEALRRDYWQHVAPAGHFRPVATLALRVDHALWGDSAWGYHATNVALHVACVAAAGLALLLLGARDRRGALPWMGLALFAATPSRPPAKAATASRRECFQATTT